MKVAFALVALLLAFSGVQGRRLLADDEGCADLSVLASVSNVTEIGKLIKGLDLLPKGLPAGVTVFLPSDEAVSEFLAALPIQGLTIDKILDPSLGAIRDTVMKKLTTALLYHVVPGTGVSGTVATALTGHSLKVEETDAGLLVTDETGTPAVAEGPLEVCGSEVFIVDKVLLPAKSANIADILMLPDTTKEQAQAALGGGAASS